MSHPPDTFTFPAGISDADEVAASNYGAAIRFVARHRVLLLVAPVVAGIAAATYALLQEPAYTASAAFAGNGSDPNRAGLSGLAAQFGVRVPAGDASQTPQFYADLLRSHQLLDAAAGTRYTYHTAGGVRAGTLDDAFEATGKSPALRRENTIMALDQRTTVSIGRETGVVRVSVSSTSAELSVAVVQRMLELINKYNLETRQSRASAERKFTEARKDAAQAELRASEERVEAFNRANRKYLNSPDLGSQSQRLQRDVGMRSQVYTTLVQAFEQARIDEVRDTPVISVIEPPYLPVRPDRRGLIRTALFAMVLATVAGGALAAALDLWRARAGTPLHA